MTTTNTNSSARTLTIPNLVNGQIYRARVSAVNNYGQGPFANWIQVTPSEFSTDQYYYDNTLLMHFDDNRTGIYDLYGDYVSLLMHMDGENNSTTFIDSSLYGRTIFVNGPAKLSSDQSMFGTTSAAFDSNASYLRVTSGPDFAFPSDFTIECWVYFTNSSRGYQGIIGAHNGNDQTGWLLYLENNNTLNFATSAGSGWSNGVGAGEGVTPNAWHHIAVSRSGSSLRLFVDGILKGTSTNSVNVASASVIDIGDYTCLNQYGYNFTMSGYIDDLRITKGVARYISNFSIPTEAFPTISPLFVDSSPYQRRVTPYGNATLSNTQSKFGNSSVYFDGSSMLSVPSSSDLDLGDIYTIEAWVLSNDTSRDAGILARGQYQGYQGGAWNGLTFSIRTSSAVSVYFWATNNGNEQTLTVPNALVQGQWTHVAVVRNGTNGYVYINGILGGSISNLNTNGASSRNLLIGRWDYDRADESSVTSHMYFDGYLDDVRITKGVARYTSNFSVPVAPAPDFGPAPTVPSSPSNLTVSEDQGIVLLSWNRPSYPRVVDTRAPITYYGVEYSGDGGSSWTEDSGPFIVESILNFNDLSDFTNNFTTSQPVYYTYSISNGTLQINAPTLDATSTYSFAQDKNLLDFEINFLTTYHGYRVPYLTLTNDLGSVYISYNTNWVGPQPWGSALGSDYPNNVIVGITPAGGSTTWYAHSSPRLDNSSIFNTIKTTINTTNKTMTLTVNGISETYTNNMFGSGFKNFTHNPMAMNFNNSYTTYINYIKYTTDDTSITNRRLSSLTSGSPYLFRVRAQNSVGFGPYSSTANILTLTNAPSGVSAIGDDNQAFISWTAPTPNNSSIRDYAIQYSSDSAASWDTYSHSPSTDTLINVTGLNNAFNYSFKVAAVNFAGTGIYSTDSSSISLAPRADNLYNKTRILLHLDSN